MASLRELRVLISGDDSGLRGALNSATGGLGRMGPAALAAGAAIAAGLAAAGTALVAIGGEFDEAYDTIRVGTGATGDALAGLQDDFRAVAAEVPASFGDVGTVVADLNTRLGLTGQPLQELSGQFLDLARITGGDLTTSVADVTRVFGDWALDDQAGSLDAMFRATQATGAGMEQLSSQLVQFGAPLRQLGFGFEDSLAILGQFEQEGVNTELVLGSMRQALGRMARAGEPAVETFQRVTDEIANAGSASEANALALELFGARAGPDMAAAIREGRFEVDALTAAIANGSETISGAADDTADWQESFQLLKNNALLAIEPIAARVFGALGAAVEAITPRVHTMVATVGPVIDGLFNGLTTWWTDNGPTITAAISTATATIREGFDQVAAWWTEHGPTVTETIQTTTAAIGGAFDTVVVAVQDVIAWFGQTFGEEGQAAGELTEFTTNVSSWATQISEIIGSWVEVNRIAIETFIEAVRWAWAAWGEDLVTFVVAAWDAVEGVISGALDIIQGTVDTWLALFQGDWSGAWDATVQVLQGVWEIMQSVVTLAADALFATINMALGAFGIDWELSWAGIVQFHEDAWANITAAFNRLWADLRSHYDEATGQLSGAWATFTSGLGTTWDGLWQGLADGWSAVWSPIKNAVDGAVGDGSPIRDTWKTFTIAIGAVWDAMWANFQAALEVGGAVYSGLTNAFGSLVDGLGTAWQAVQDVFKAPVQWVADNVFDAGIIRAWNAIARLVPGLSEVGELNLAFAAGGLVPGVGDRDSVAARLMPEEIVIRKAIAKPYKDFLLAFNAGQPEALAAAGRPEAVQRFADGGLVAAVDFAKAQAGKPYGWGAVGPGAYDCSGFLSAIQNVLEGRNPHSRRFTSASIGGGDGWVSGSGGVFDVGTRRGVGRGSGGHVAGTLDGMHVESAGSVGVRVGPGAWGATHSYFNEILTLPGDWLRERVVALVEAIFGPLRSRLEDWAAGQGLVGELLGGAGRVPMDATIGWLRHGDIPGLADGGIIRATPGGQIFRAGEAGRDEAVIPLDQFFGAGFTTSFDPILAAGGGRTVYDDLTQLVTASTAAPASLVQLWGDTATDVTAQTSETLGGLALDVASTLDDLDVDIDTSLEGVAGSITDFAAACESAAARITAAAAAAAAAATPVAAATPGRPQPPTPAVRPQPDQPDHYTRPGQTGPDHYTRPGGPDHYTRPGGPDHYTRPDGPVAPYVRRPLLRRAAIVWGQD